MKTVEEVLKDRGENYGSFYMDASLAQGIKEVLQAHPGWAKLAADQKQAMEMIATKMARAVNGNPDHQDHWLDIEGYARLVRVRLDQEAAHPEGEPSALLLLTRSLRKSEDPSR